MKRCKHFDYCSAPICPKDKDSHLRVRLAGEPKCKRKDLLGQKDLFKRKKGNQNT